jgi:hypothetical protein
MTRRIVFAGGAQMRALARAYRGEAGESGNTINFVDTDLLRRENAKRAIATASTLVVEVGDGGELVPAAMIPEKAEVLRVPQVRADFLWPFAGRPHPRNVGSTQMPEGPYPAEHGDSFLDRMLEEGVSEDEAVERYLALDVAREADLDALLEGRLARQEALDQATGYDLADFIQNRFRGTYLFASRERPRLPLFRRVTAILFQRLGAGEAAGLRVRQVPFAGSMQPIHPGVLAHFGMTTPPADRRYPMLDEGTFTFEDYCHRYVRFAWNEALHQGIALARTDPTAAIPILRQGLAISPDSRGGRRALRLALGTVPGEAEADGEAAAYEAGAEENDELEQPGPQAMEAPSPEAEPYTAPPVPELIGTRPVLLEQEGALAASLDRPFASMPEMMPPPPLAPELMPELEPVAPEPPRRGFFSKLLKRS